MPRNDQFQTALVSTTPAHEFLSQEVARDPGSLSTRRTIDFSTVPATELRAEVVKRAVQYLGQSTYNNMGAHLRRVLSKPGAACSSFFDLEMALMMTGIEGFSTVLMLAIDWGLSEYLQDFASKFHEGEEALAQ